MQAEKLEAQQQAEECKAQMASIQADMHSLRIQLEHAAARPAPGLPPLQPSASPGLAAFHPLQSVLGEPSGCEFSKCPVFFWANHSMVGDPVLELQTSVMQPRRCTGIESPCSVFWYWDAACL